MQTNEAAVISAIKFNGYKIELSTNVKGQPVARLYKYLTMGKNKDTWKLQEGYYFGNEEKREAWIKERISTLKGRIDERQKDKEERKAAAGEHTFKVGDLLYQSWGYDQTNIDFFEITGVLPKSVKIRPIAENMVNGSGGFMCENVTPAKGEFTGGERTKPVKAYISGGKPHYYICNGRHHLSLYDYGEKGVYQSHYA